MVSSTRIRPDRLKASHLCVLALGLLAFGAGLVDQPAVAQDQDLRALIDRVERLQREITTLQRTVYQGAPPPADAGAAVAEDVSAPQAARLTQRIQQLEIALRGVTGQIEQQSHQIQKLTKRMDKLVVDVDHRLQMIERQLAGGEPPLGSAEPSTPARAAEGQLPSSDAPKVIGTITAADRAALDAAQEAGDSDASTTTASSVPGTQSAALPDTGPKASYDEAFKLLRQRKFDEAEVALAAFLKRYPKDPLAGNAKYWLGETYYVRGQFAEAAVTFAEGFQSYPTSVKAPDNLLKLGKSLAELDKVPDACATFSELVKRYPSAPATILQQARQDQQRLKLLVSRPAADAAGPSSPGMS